MRIGYADPPYPGQARRHYGRHRDYAGEVDHEELVARLERDYDAWILHTSASALRQILMLCPEPEWRRPATNQWPSQRDGTGVRVCAWVKPMTPFKPGSSIQWGWEPIIIRGGRQRALERGMLRDWISCSPVAWQKQGPDAVTGMKPPPVIRYTFEAIGAEPGDELDDLYTGSGAVAAEWEAWHAAPQMRYAGRLENDAFPELELDPA